MPSGDVTILAGGWSVKNLALDRLCGEVIGVNDSAVRAPHVDRIVTMDRLWLEYRWADLVARKLPTWVRVSAAQNIPVDQHWPALTVFENDNASVEFSSDPKRLNGTNSGFCAMNLAYQMKPARLFLLGFDMNRDNFGRAYWHDAYPWNRGYTNGTTSNGKYAQWAKQFARAAALFQAAGIEVFNVSPQSAIQNFRKITPAQYMRECK